MQPSQLLALLQTTDKSKFNVAQDTFTVQNLSDHLHITYLTTDSRIVTRRRCLVGGGCHTGDSTCRAAPTVFRRTEDLPAVFHMSNHMFLMGSLQPCW